MTLLGRLLSPRRLLRPPLPSSAVAAGNRLARRLHSSTTKLFPEDKRSLDEAGPLACPLTSRSILRFRGPDVFKFLQGLLTNDVRALDEPRPAGDGHGNEHAAADAVSSFSPLPTPPNMPLYRPAPLYAAMLTPQGRFLYDLFLYRPSRPREKLDRAGSGPAPDGPHEQMPTLFADVDATVLDELLACLRKYRLRSKVEIENVTEELTCWQHFGSGLSEISIEDPEAAAVGWGGGIDRAGASSAKGNNFDWRWFRDPRLNSLGFRGIFPADTIPPLVESDKEANEECYLLWRLERGVAEGSTEMLKGEAIPLEYNLAGLNAISFDKGCYVGQELVARTHHRGVIRKRLLPFKFVNESGAEVERKVPSGSEIVDETSDKKVGTVTTAIGCHGMGVLRFEEAFKPSPLTIKGQEDVNVKVIRPDWWPAEWTQDYNRQSTAA